MRLPLQPCVAWLGLVWFGWLTRERGARGRIVTKTQAYLEVFSRFKQQETAQAVERILLLQKDLTSFERAQLGMRPPGRWWWWLEMRKAYWVEGSLCCDNADEAKTLIPSLADKRSDEDLQELLEEVYTLARLVGLG